MAVSWLKPIFDMFETEATKKRRLYLETVYELNKDSANIDSPDIAKALNYDYNTAERIADYWIEKGCFTQYQYLLTAGMDNPAGGIIGPGANKLCRTLKITAKGIDEVEKHWFKKFIDRNNNLITIVIAFVSLAISFAAILISILKNN